MKDGEPYVQGQRYLIECEIGEVDEEVEEVEVAIKALAMDLHDKEQHLSRCLAAEAQECRKVGV